MPKRVGRKTSDDNAALGSHHDAGIAAELAEAWRKVNDLPEPREGVYPDNIRHPGGEEKPCRNE